MIKYCSLLNQNFLTYYLICPLHNHDSSQLHVFPIDMIVSFVIINPTVYYNLHICYPILPYYPCIMKTKPDLLNPHVTYDYIFISHMHVCIYTSTYT